MRLQMREGSTIENPRSYANHAVESLRELLAAESHVQSDPNRHHFYQLEDDRNAYYIHVSPITGNVILLAKWTRQAQDCYTNDRAAWSLNKFTSAVTCRGRCADNSS